MASEGTPRDGALPEASRASDEAPPGDGRDAGPGQHHGSVLNESTIQRSTSTATPNDVKQWMQLVENLVADVERVLAVARQEAAHDVAGDLRPVGGDPSCRKYFPKFAL